MEIPSQSALSLFFFLEEFNRIILCQKLSSPTQGRPVRGLKNAQKKMPRLAQTKERPYIIRIGISYLLLY
jgi:hypothetical protein